MSSPDDFIPELPGWRARSPFISQQNNLTFFHYDLYSQALSKIERGHSQDLKDVRSMLEAGLVTPDELMALFSQIESQLYRYPAIDPPSFRQAVERALER